MTKDARKRHLILHDPNIYKGLLVLAIPLMFNNLIKTIHDIVDMYFVSNIPGYSTEAINAISLTFPVFFTFLSLGIGISAAGTALISQYLGSNQTNEAKKYASNLTIISFVVGIILMVSVYFLAEPIMRFMGTEGYVLENSVKYLQIRTFELPFVFLFFAFTAIRQSSGDTMTPVIYGVITLIFNIILSPIFISVLGFGVAGAGISTLIANIAIVPIIVYQLFKSKTGVVLDRYNLKVDRLAAKKIIVYAIPASLGQSVTSIGFIITNSIIITYGIQTVAAFSVGNRINSLILHPVMAIGGVLSAYLGQNIGNRNPSRAREAFKKSMILSAGLMAVGGLLLMLIREPVTSIFIKDDPVALRLTVEYLFYVIISLPFMGIFQNFVGTFNGTGDTRYTFIFTITRLWLFRIPLILLFKNYTNMGSTGIWIAMLISNVAVLFLGMYLYTKIDFMPKIELTKLKAAK